MMYQCNQRIFRHSRKSVVWKTILLVGLVMGSLYPNLFKRLRWNDDYNISLLQRRGEKVRASSPTTTPLSPLGIDDNQTATTTDARSNASRDKDDDLLSFWLWNRHLYPLTYMDEIQQLLPSFVHCVGESFDGLSKNHFTNNYKNTTSSSSLGDSDRGGLEFVYRSCYFQNLCLRLTHHQQPEFLFIVDDESNNISQRWLRDDYYTSLQQEQNQGHQQEYANEGTGGDTDDDLNATTSSAAAAAAPLRLISSSTSMMEDWWTRQNNDHHSPPTTKSVALSAISGQTLAQKRHLEWFPRVVHIKDLMDDDLYDIKGYYQLDPDVVLLPFAWYRAYNPGHVLWDNLLPMYKLLTMFGLWSSTSNELNPTLHSHHNLSTTPPSTTFSTSSSSVPRLLLMNMPLDGPVSGACRASTRHNACQRMMEKFLPLMGLSLLNLMHLGRRVLTTTNTSTNNNATTHVKGLLKNETDGINSMKPPTSTLICARQTVAGLGLLTDHGWKDHGQFESDYTTLHNLGTSDLVYQFRRMVLRNFGMASANTLERPFHITMAANSSISKGRRLSFAIQQQAMENAFSSNDTVIIQRIVMQDLSLMEQMQVVTQSLVYISACGGSTAMATFLPRGASLVLFSQTRGSLARLSMLDFDLFNNLAYLHVHWFPIRHMDEPDELELLVQLIQYEVLDRVNTHNMDGS